MFYFIKNFNSNFNDCHIEDTERIGADTDTDISKDMSRKDEKGFNIET